MLINELVSYSCEWRIGKQLMLERKSYTGKISLTILNCKLDMNSIRKKMNTFTIGEIDG